MAAGLGLLLLLGGGAVVAQAVSNSGQEIRNKEYLRNLWRNEPVETLFPTALGLQDPEKKQGDPDTERGWTRVAVSPETSCAKALSGAVAKEAARRGCVAAVRATYVDDTGGTAASIAIVMFGDPKIALDFGDLVHDKGDADRPDQAVHALAAPGITWSDAVRAGSGSYSVLDIDTPCAVVASAGPSDGRKAGRLPEPWGERRGGQRMDREPWSAVAEGLAKSLAWRLTDLTFKGGA
ncbi:hypothetical protein IL992_16645 [Microbispora sp. NEAU-D428]|uniref:hypothetical protein n=1 Tax=Microbispora sitophila TaxID=2771537 RepID=UPI0018691932|nr:hypothetical protein [Microbispora sitophila]MBE3010813.1 hypothetical protein [Microbispora sitophila]